MKHKNTTETLTKDKHLTNLFFFKITSVLLLVILFSMFFLAMGV